MSDIDYEELFRSPLDDPDGSEPPGWGSSGAGLLIGIGMVLVLGALRAGTGAETPAVDASTSTTTTSAVAGPATPYPPEYQEFVPGLGIRAEEVIGGEETITVAFTTAVERGGDPLEPLWPIGGTWWLAATDGSGAESDRVVLGRLSPGVFSVVFPSEAFADASDPSAITMIERWDHPTVTGSSSLPFDGEPYVMPAPVVIPISAGTNLIVEELELGRFLGKAVWAIEGDGRPRARVVISAVLHDADGNRIGAYSSFPELLEPADYGVLEILWSEPFPTSQDGAVTVSVEYEVGVVETTATDLSIDLSEVPVGR